MTNEEKQAHEIIEKISSHTKEDKWMQNIRHKSLELFFKMKTPKICKKYFDFNFGDFKHFLKSKEKISKSWDKMDLQTKKIFEKKGIKKTENKFAGLHLQKDSTAIYKNIKKNAKNKGIIFEDMNDAIKKYPEITKKYFSKCIKNTNHKFIALHYAFWNGGTFLVVPKNTKIEENFQSYFTINSARAGQFEHSLIIAKENSNFQYVEGCSAKKHNKTSIHAGAVEIFVEKNASVQYTSIENWSEDVLNLNTKKAIVQENGKIKWIGGNFGSKVSMLYPYSVLKGDNSQSEHLGITIAKNKQIQDTGAKIKHIGKNTKSKIVNRGITKENGFSVFRGDIKIEKNAENTISIMKCDNIITDEKSTSIAKPKINAKNTNAIISHEAKTEKINENDIFYLKSRGISEENAEKIIINGFLNFIQQELPVEYAVEMNKLIEEK